MARTRVVRVSWNVDSRVMGKKSKRKPQATPPSDILKTVEEIYGNFTHHVIKVFSLRCSDSYLQ